jgi:hypothetical protein
MKHPDASLSDAAQQAMKTIALQVIGHPSESLPGRWLFIRREAGSRRTANNPGDFRLFLEDDQEDFTYVYGFGAVEIAELTAAGLLTPLELEGDPREHFVLNARAVRRCRQLADGARRVDDKAPPGRIH